MSEKHVIEHVDPIEDQPADTGRRRFLGAAGMAGVAGVGLSTVLAGCRKETPAGTEGGAPVDDQASAASHQGANPHLKPGELDTYYGLWSGGHTGDVRVLGLPSGREIHRIPVFTKDALVGWGITNESKAIMGTRPDGSLKYTVGDTHHVHASYRDGNYDGRYAWVNDKINVSGQTTASCALR